MHVPISEILRYECIKLFLFFYKITKIKNFYFLIKINIHIHTLCCNVYYINKKIYHSMTSKFPQHSNSCPIDECVEFLKVENNLFLYKNQTHA